MTHKQHRPPLALAHLIHLPQTLLLKLSITYRQHFINDKYLRLQMSGHRKGQAHFHAAAIVLHRCVDELLHAAEVDDGVKFLSDFRTPHAKNGAVQIYILAAGELRVKTSADFQE